MVKDNFLHLTIYSRARFSILVILIFFLAVGLLTFNLALAQTTPLASSVNFQPQIGIPNSQFQAGGKVAVTGYTIASYINAFYVWAIRAVAILAIFIIMLAGFRWLTAAGNATAIGRAKNQMIDAFIGLILILCANLMLYLINPALVRFKDLSKQITTVTPVNLSFSRECTGISYSGAAYGGGEAGCKSICSSADNVEEFYQTSVDQYPDNWCCVCKGCPANSESLPAEYRSGGKNCRDYCGSKDMRGGQFSDKYPDCCRCVPKEATKEACEGVKNPTHQTDCTSYGGLCVWGGVADEECVCRYHGGKCHWYRALSQRCATEIWDKRHGSFGTLVPCNESDVCMNGSQPKDCQNIGTKICIELDSSPGQYAAQGYDGACCAETTNNNKTGEYKCIY